MEKRQTRISAWRFFYCKKNAKSLTKQGGMSVTLYIGNLIEVSASLALIALAILLIIISFQVVPFFKKLNDALEESTKTMEVYRKVGEESVIAIQQGQEILEAGKEISNDVIETKRAITSTGSAICSNVLDIVLEVFNK